MIGMFLKFMPAKSMIQTIFQFLGLKKKKEVIEDKISSYESKQKIAKEYHKDYYIERLRQIDGSMHRCQNLSSAWNHVKIDSVAESDSLILYLCANFNHTSSEIHSLSKGENVNTPFWMDNIHNYGDGNVIPCVYRIIPSYFDAETTAQEKWNKIFIRAEIGQQVPKEILKSNVLAINFDETKTDNLSIQYYTVDSCFYVYGLMTDVDQSVCWGKDGFDVIGYLTLND